MTEDKVYLFSIDMGVEVYAPNYQEALDRLEPKDTEYCRIVHQDVMLVEGDDTCDDCGLANGEHDLSIEH